MWKWIGILLLGIFLAWQAIEDFRKKSIRMDLVLIFGMIGIVVFFLAKGIQMSTVIELVVSCLPGMIVLVVSHICTGMIGEGDGMIFLITGIYMGLVKNGLLIYISFLLVCVVGLIRLFSFGKKKKTKTYPLVPFIFSAFLIIELWGIRL